MTQLTIQKGTGSMASIILCGGGVIGLSAAMMLARDGHKVTVLEADPHEPPATAAEAWQSWERKGVAQFRQPHNLFARFRQVCDEVYRFVTGRRPVAESVIAAAAQEQPGVTVRRGVQVTEVITGAAAIPGVPHVAGVRTSDGAEAARRPCRRRDGQAVAGIQAARRSRRRAA